MPRRDVNPLWRRTKNVTPADGRVGSVVEELDLVASDGETLISFSEDCVKIPFSASIVSSGVVEPLILWVWKGR